MIIDCHVHVCAMLPGHGITTPKLRRRPSFAFMRWRLGIPFFADDAGIEQAVAAKLVETVQQTTELDAVVVLAFDGVHTADGQFDAARTQLYVTNDYVIDLVRQHPKMYFGASIHPYRKDAIAELERCVAAGAALMKWLPLVQDIDPTDRRCLEFYDALAHHKLPLLSHTGGEMSLPYTNYAYADPELLLPAIQRGVTVIAAHCGTRATPFETDFLPKFVRLTKEHEHLYGDTAALNLPLRSYAYKTLLDDEAVRKKLVHGSDWPIISVPPARAGLWTAMKLFMTDNNWLRRDVLAKRAMGLGEDYWQRAATLLRTVR